MAKLGVIILQLFTHDTPEVQNMVGFLAPIVSNPKHQTPNPKTLNTKPQTPNPRPSTPNTKPQTPNPRLSTPNPKHKTLNTQPRHVGFLAFIVFLVQRRKLFQARNPKPKPLNPKP